MKPTLWLVLATLAVMVPDLSSGMARQTQVIQQDIKQMIQINISGTHGTRYSGSLTIHNNSESDTYPLDGSVPTQLEYPGEGVTLEITVQSEGSLALEVRQGGNLSTSRAEGVGSVMQLSVR
ncbi:hypothetical protein ACR80S_04665 [Halomonas sp. MA07-2]|uniref:hypothetical protein n=1 Tax=unclassified Halomonas TaxID=2609666 RepID=UPI003EEDAFAF